ncbi:MAG: efflux RND transporter periplasmic adaptor subunit [Telluria sp.]
MKRTLVMTGAVLLAAALAGGAGYLAGRRAVPAAAVPVAAERAAQERRILYWQDPMVPGQHFDKPGKSPYMDMQLVPVYADDPGAAAGVRIDARAQQNLGMRTAEATRERMQLSVEAPGSVAWDETSSAVVQARAAGFVERLFVRAPFTSVRAGQPLAELFVPEWTAAQEEFLAVRRLPRPAPELADAARQRLRLAGMTDDQVRAVEAAGQPLRRFTLRAPRAGVVTELAVREGAAVAPGATLFRLNAADPVWVLAQVPEQAAPGLRANAEVGISAPALPGWHGVGRLALLLPEVDPATRTRQARIVLPNRDRALAAGMLVSVQLAGPVREAVTVPSEAVVRTGERSLVFVAEDGRFVPVQVQPGAEQGGRTEIRSGLAAGQKVVVSGQFLVDSEASIKGLLQRMAGPAEVAAAGELHAGQGRVEQIGAASITLSHGPIPTLKWGAMTMDFQLPPQGLPPDIHVGDTVDFTIRAAAQGFRIASIRPAAAAAVPSAAAPAHPHEHEGGRP